jgi:hypothetical protein
MYLNYIAISGHASVCYNLKIQVRGCHGPIKFQAENLTLRCICRLGAVQVILG